MYHKEKAVLLHYVATPSDLSDDGPGTKNGVEVYINPYRVTWDDRLQSRVEGLRLEGRAALYAFEYSGQTHIRIREKEYCILSAEEAGEHVLLSYGERLGERD